MARTRPEPTAAQRAALLRFEALYEEWRVATLNLVEAEERLVAESLSGEQGLPPRELTERVQQLRAAERAAYDRALEARLDTDD